MSHEKESNLEQAAPDPWATQIHMMVLPAIDPRFGWLLWLFTVVPCTDIQRSHRGWEPFRLRFRVTHLSLYLYCVVSSGKWSPVGQRTEFTSAEHSGCVSSTPHLALKKTKARHNLHDSRAPKQPALQLEFHGLETQTKNAGSRD